MAAPAGCQLYLAAPAELPPDFAATLAAVLEAAEIACLRLPPRPGIGDLVRLAQGRGTAVVTPGERLNGAHSVLLVASVIWNKDNRDVVN